MNVESFTFGPFGTNTYVVSDEQGNAVLIDPACFYDYERQQLLKYLSPFGSHISIVATHGHLDHLWGAKWACEQWNVPVMIDSADMPMVKAMQTQYNMFGLQLTAEPFPTDELKETSFQFSPFRFQLIHTPGHTPGSVCLYLPDERLLFSGDTLFRCGYGRTDLPGGNTAQLIDSLRRLAQLPPDTRVLPGHGEPTVIGDERLC